MFESTSKGKWNIEWGCENYSSRIISKKYDLYRKKGKPSRYRIYMKRANDIDGKDEKNMNVYVFCFRKWTTSLRTYFLPIISRLQCTNIPS